MVLEVPVTSADCLEIIHLRTCVALLAIPPTRPALGRGSPTRSLTRCGHAASLYIVRALSRTPQESLPECTGHAYRVRRDGSYPLLQTLPRFLLETLAHDRVANTLRPLEMEMPPFERGHLPLVGAGGREA